MDFSVIKSWRFSERQGLEFRAEFFNLPNHSLWSLPGASPGTNTYGMITSTVLDSSQLQFGLKYGFLWAGRCRAEDSGEVFAP